MDSQLFTQIVEQYEQLKYTLLKAQTFDPKHYGFSPIYYQIMESDRRRIRAFYQAFKQYNDFEGKIVCEAGVGRLALTKYFLPKVKKAYLIESNPYLQAEILSMIKEHNWDDKMHLIMGDARQIVLPESVDFVVGELMSIYCGNEYQVQIFQHLRQFLKPNGKLLPEKIINIIQLASADFEENHQHYPINFSRHLPEILSLQTIVNTINLYTETALIIEKTLTITPILSGTANAVYMRSLVQIAKSCNFTGTDSLMPPTVCRLQQAYQLTEGVAVQLKCQFTYGTNLDQAKFWIA